MPVASKEWVVPTSWGELRFHIDNARVLMTAEYRSGEQIVNSLSSVETAQLLLALQECAKESGAKVGKAATRRKK